MNYKLIHTLMFFLLLGALVQLIIAIIQGITT